MEAGRNLLSSSPSFPTRTHLKNSFSSSSSVTSVPVTSMTRHFPASVLLQEQRDEYKPFLHIFKEDKTSQATIDGKQMETGFSSNEDMNSSNLEEVYLDFEEQFLHWPDLWNILPSSETGRYQLPSLTLESAVAHSEKLRNVEQCNVVSLARKALSASKQAAQLAEDLKFYQPDLDESLSSSLGSASSADCPVEEQIRVRSTRLLERKSKNRRVSKSKVLNNETYRSQRVNKRRKLKEDFDPDDALRLFLWGPETRQLLTPKEESELIVRIQDLARLEKVKDKLQSQFGREPTVVEWAEAVGLSCQVLQSEVHSGKRSQEKLITANLRMVVHIAKQYLGRGLSLQDLLQEGGMGLTKSVEKFKPRCGCRFATYAYWWIRQSIRKAIFQHSRTVRLPENVYSLLGKLMEAKRSCVREGSHYPTKEELARRVGITVDKLEKLLFSTRMPLSMQQAVWADQETTFQEVTADMGIEIPDVSVGKQLMRQHVRNLLGVLSPKERRIIKLRFGIEDGKQKSLSEIGEIFGLSKERVRQLESRALYRLKQCMNSHGLGAYSDLLI